MSLSGNQHITIVGRFLQKLLKGGDQMPHEVKDLPIQADWTRRLSDPAFGATVSAGSHSLHVPVIVAKVLEDLAITSASAFVSYARTYPSAIAEGLEMDLHQVEHACNVLVEQLHGHVDEALLVQGEVGDFGFGALLPGQ